MELRENKTYHVAYFYTPFFFTKNPAQKRKLINISSINKYECQFSLLDVYYRITHASGSAISHHTINGGILEFIGFISIVNARFGQIIKIDRGGRYIIVCETMEYLNKAISKTKQYREMVEFQKEITKHKITIANKEVAKIGHLNQIIKL